MKALLSTLFVGVLTIGVELLSSTAACAALPVAVEGQPLPTLAPLLERVQKSVVKITVEADVQMRRRRDPLFEDPFFRRFFDQGRSSPSRQRQVTATGVIVDAINGYILTNQHSVVGANLVSVTLADGRQAEAEVVGSDKASDIAVLKIGLNDLTEIALGDSNELRVGDFVVSIGDPIGQNNTVITGVISSLATGGNSPTFENFIQSDAGYGPGVLVNLRGEFIGLNISKVAQTAANNRIGFSTPVNMALKVKSQLVKYGTPQRGFLSVQVQDLTPALAAAFNVRESRGAVITAVTPESNAENAGLRVGDVVVMADKKVVQRGVDLSREISMRFAGDPLPITIIRNGEVMEVSVLLESSAVAMSKGNMIHHRLEGATFKGIDAQQVSTSAEQGVLVTDVKQGSIAWGHGVRPNDVIVSANRRLVTGLDSFRKAISNHDVLMLNIVRGNGNLFLLLQ